jgi:periplasmic protein TonB
MFEHTILDTSESAPRSRRWTTAFSFMLQALAVCLLLLVPLLYTDALPAVRYSAQLTVPPAAPAPRSIELVDTHTEHSAGTSEMFGGRIIAPPRIPDSINRVVDRENLAAPDPNAVFNSVGSNSQSSAMQQVLTARAVPPPHPDVHRSPVHVSKLDEGAILKRVQPVYPAPARAARIQGRVVIAALIDTEGRIVNLHLVSGNPLLVNAAMDAVKQWRYRPYILNSQAIEVETQITVAFTLN